MTDLSAFVESVPPCTDTDTLANACQLFRTHQCDRLVVTDPQHYPVGIIWLDRLLPCLLEDPASNLSVESGFDRNTPISVLGSSIVEPSIALSADLSLDRFWLYFKHASDGNPSPSSTDNPRTQYALTDASGRYLGLLDLTRALATIAQSQASSPNSSVSLPRLSSRDRPRGDPNLDTLCHFLEQIPLPMMLQTRSGRPIAQNLAWREQLGKLQDPNRVRQAAAAMLDRATSHLSTIATVSNPAHQCRIGGNADTCICECTMKGGQDRIWQFVKVPVGESFLVCDRPAIDSQPWQVTDATTSFHLATLEPPHAPEAATATASDRLSTLWLVLARDVTEQEYAARELAAKNADLIQLNRLKDEFLALIGHELKTPLTAVLGLSSLLKDRMLGPLNDRQARYTQLIYQSGRHLMTVVNDILDLTRIETGQLELELEPVSIAEACDRAYRQACQLHPGSPSQTGKTSDPAAIAPFQLDIEPGLDRLVADRARLCQMLANLLSNALKFTAPEGNVGLRVGRWEDWIAFTVWDTGIGIPATKQHLIFQKFQQLESPLNRQFEGTGLGLVLVQKLARAHGGEVSFVSAEGEGSEFTLLLPPIPPKPESPSVEEQAAQSNRLILVVESAACFVENLRARLQEAGYWVAIARSGTEALEKARRLQPRLVFLNPVLPLLSGWDVLRLLKTDDRTAHLSIVVTAAPSDRARARRYRADDFLQLPVDPSALQQCLTNSIPFAAAARPLVVLKLTPNDGLASPEGDRHRDFSDGVDLDPLFHQNCCRILEADDLDQAELLARIWKPDAILLVPTSVTSSRTATPVRVACPVGTYRRSKMLAYLDRFSTQPHLASVPLVTLDPDTTEAANQIAARPGTTLQVFPCLIAPDSRSSSDIDPNSNLPALLQAIQVAAGCARPD